MPDESNGPQFGAETNVEVISTAQPVPASDAVLAPAQHQSTSAKKDWSRFWPVRFGR